MSGHEVRTSPLLCTLESQGPAVGAPLSSGPLASLSTALEAHPSLISWCSSLNPCLPQALLCPCDYLKPHPLSPSAAWLID